ncbi:MAG: DUF58 domain-containing protein [Chloroflexi bacterium]|nr:DUF58 domain-containing protein [Chloroflexota bacterium]
MQGGAWLLITLALLVASAILRQAPLLMLALLFFLASGIARLWARFALEGVQYERRLSDSRVFFGETVTLEVSAANRKLLPLPWLEVQDEVPEELTYPKGKVSASHKPARAILSNFLSLGWYHRLTRRYPVQCLRRGYFSFGPATIRSGDLFGFFDRGITDERLDHLLVYPRIVPLETLGIPSRDPFGDLRLRRHLFEDPVQVASIRQYAPGDPLKRIHWKATARLQQLQTRVFEHTTTVDLALFLDVRTVEPPYWGKVEQLLETAVIAAASIANHAIENGYRVGLYANETYRSSGRRIALPASDHPEQLQRLLEALAHVQGLPLMSLEQLLAREGRSLPWSTTLTVITAVPVEPLLAALARYRRAGRRVALIVVGPDARRYRLTGISTYRVSDDVYWRELASVRLGTEGGL